MKKKEVYHEKEEVCNLSRQMIDTEKEDYCIVMDCRGDKVMKTKFYKNKDFKNYIEGNNKKNMNSTVKKYQKWAGELIGNIQKQYGSSNKPKEEYVVK